MANNIISTRIILKNDTLANWSASTLVLLKGEAAYVSDTTKIKFGDGVHTFTDLAYATMTPTEIQNLVNGSVSTVALSSGTNNGTLAITVNGTKTDNVAVTGLGSAAYTNSTAYATAAQGTKADNAMPKSGGTFTGAVVLNGAPTADLHPTTKKYVDDLISSSIQAADSMTLKGTIGTSGTVTALPTSGILTGDTYKAITAGTISAAASYGGAASSYKIGDLIVAMSSSTWLVVPSGDEEVTTVKYSTSTTNLTTAEQTGAITLGEAATKQVDSSIAAASTSTKVPTSAAVATFVEGKGYALTTGNIASATKLATARKINTVAFDGTADITIDANPTETELTAEDLNSITTPGFYFASVSNTVTNKPSGVDGFALVVYKSSAGWIVQDLSETDTGVVKKYTRSYTTTAWLTWDKYYTQQNPPAAGDVSANTALKLASPVTIGISGGATGTATSFDGSANITIPVTSLDATSLTGTAAIDTTGNAATATKATKDSAGNTINTTYIKGLSASGTTVTYTKGDDTTGTITTQDTTYANATSSTAGLMSAADKAKLDGVASSADNVTVSAALTSGTKVATVTIDGTATDLYCETNTDTHYESSTIVNGTATSAANTTTALTNGNVYLNHIENGAVKSSHKISGSGATTVTADSAGNLVVTSTDNNTTYSAGSGLVLSGTTFNHSNSVTAGTASGDTSKTLTFGGTFTIPSVTYDSQGHITAKSSTTMTMPATPTTITGNAGTATTLATARTIAISGGVTGTATSFDGSANISIPVTKVDTDYIANGANTLVLDCGTAS